MITTKLAYLLAEILGQDEEDISEQTQFTEEYGIKPIDVAALVIAAEKEFHITIHDDEAAGFKNLGDVVRYINKGREDY